MSKLYDNLDQIAGLGFRGSKTISKKLEDNRENAYLSYELATIKLDCELPARPEELINGAADNEKLVTLFTELNFKRWLAEAQSGNAGIDSVAAGASASAGASSASAVKDAEFSAAAIDRSQYDTVLTEEAFHAWMEKLRAADVVAFDTETDSLNYMEANLVGLSFAIAPGEAAYVPVAHDYLDAPKQLDRDWVIAEMKGWLEDAGALKVGQNLKYDASVLARYDINMKGIAFDTMLESYVYNSVAGRHDMDSLATRYLQHKCISFEEIAGKGKKQLTFNQIELEQAAPYAAEDADVTLRLHLALMGHINSDDKLKAIFEQYEMPLVPVLSRIERHGVLIDSDMLGKQSQEIAARLDVLEKETFDLAGEEFNLSSPKQLQAILFEKMGLPVIKKHRQAHLQPMKKCCKSLRWITRYQNAFWNTVDWRS